MTQREELSETFGAQEDAGESLDLGKYLDVVRKWKWIILAIMAVGITLTVLYTMRQPKIYQASASIVVSPHAPQVFGNELQEVVQLGSGNYWSSAEYYNTQIEILEGHDQARQTVLRHRLYENPKLMAQRGGEDLPEADRIELATKILDDTISATKNNDSRIVHIRVLSPDPALAADLANKHAETFIATNLDVRTEGTDDAAKFLATELDAAEDRLRKAEQSLHTFKTENEIISVSLEDKMNLLAADLARYTAALSDARIKRIELASLRRRAKAAAAEGKVLESPIFALTESTTVGSLKDLYLSEKQKFVDVSGRLGPRHPEYVTQKKKVDELYGAIQAEARLAMREIEERYQTALANEKQFAAEVDRLKQEALDLAPKTIAYNRLERREKSDAENYQMVLGRLRASQLSGRNRIGNITPHDAAREPKFAVSPRMELNVGIAAVLSLLLGLLLAFGLDYLDRSLKTAEDVEKAVGLPLLGLIPIVGDNGKGSTPEVLKERDLYVFTHPKSPAAECCRSIRTNILFSGADRPLKTITLSSPNPREGKTTSVIYLGTTMAQSGQRVLLVDTDMRKPRLHKSMGVSRTRGLSNLILGNESYDDCIKSTEINNLFVLPCGPMPPNPAELLLTNRFKQILDELGERFDRILLDSPPLQAVTDAVVLAKISDGVIVVAQGGKTVRDDLIRSVRQLRDVDAHIVGVVLNDLDISEKKYGYYYYAYGYGDGTQAAEADS